MKNQSVSFLVFALVLGCPATPAMPDAASPDASVADDARQPRDAAASPDAAGCVDVSGAWVWTGTCITAASFVPPDGCIAQVGCNIHVTETTVQDAEMVALGSGSGTIVGNRLTFDSGGTTFTYVFNGNTATWEGGGCMATGVRSTFPGATSYCCGVTGSDCGAGERCQVFGHEVETFHRFTACVPDGTIAEGGVCTRSMMGRVGADTCSAGTACTNINSPAPGDRMCTQLCATASDCASNQRCWTFSASPRAGACRDTCAFFGSTCPMGTTCRTSLSWADLDGPPVVETGCSAIGTTPAGGTCADSVDCAANHDCFFDPAVGPTSVQCRQICDPTHACPTGQSCTVRRGNAAGLGTCFPTL